MNFDSATKNSVKTPQNGLERGGFKFTSAHPPWKPFQNLRCVCLPQPNCAEEVFFLPLFYPSYFHQSSGTIVSAQLSPNRCGWFLTVSLKNVGRLWFQIKQELRTKLMSVRSPRFVTEGLIGWKLGGQSPNGLRGAQIAPIPCRLDRLVLNSGRTITHWVVDR